MLNEARRRIEDSGEAFQAHKEVDAPKSTAVVPLAAPVLKSAAAELHDYASRLLEEHKFDIDKASGALEKLIWADRNKRDALVEPLVKNACRGLIRRIAGNQRRRSWTGQDERGSTDRLIALGRGTAAALMDFLLPETNKPLWSATGAEVITAAEFYEVRSRDAIAKTRWLRLIADNVPSGQVVGKTLTAERLAELQAEALQ